MIRRLIFPILSFMLFLGSVAMAKNGHCSGRKSKRNNYCLVRQAGKERQRQLKEKQQRARNERNLRKKALQKLQHKKIWRPRFNKVSECRTTLERPIRALVEVPHRLQDGPTCGLYALGMAMDFWHSKNVKNPAPIVTKGDLLRKAYNTWPRNMEPMLKYARSQGYTKEGGMFDSSHLAEVAQYYGYDVKFHSNATVKDINDILARKRVAIIPLDLSASNNGACGFHQGVEAHYVIISDAFVASDNKRYLVVKHPYPFAGSYFWLEEDVIRSWSELNKTFAYRNSGLPKALDLPRNKDGSHNIKDSLASTIIEVIPRFLPERKE